MGPFETLIKDLGNYMNLVLKPDANQSCRLEYTDGPSIQIDLDPTGENVLLGTQLGEIPPGIYRIRILKQALRVNGLSTFPRGFLAFSEKNNTLVLFQYLPLLTLTGETLFHFLQQFHMHAKIWLEALKKGEVPTIEEDME